MDPNSLRFLRASHRDFAEAVALVLPGWRFKPARVGPCAVRQLVQLPFEFAMGGDGEPRSVFGIESQFPRPLRTPPIP